MLDLKELLIILGLAAGGPGDLPTIDFYIHELRSQSMNEKKLKEEIKLLEFKKMYDDVDKKNMDFVKKWDKVDTKTDKALSDKKIKLKDTREKIKILKQVIQKDSLDKLPPQIQVL
jgi:hypothetical protein